jgi:hypothetical protein
LPESKAVADGFERPASDSSEVNRCRPRELRRARGGSRRSGALRPTAAPLLPQQPSVPAHPRSAQSCFDPPERVPGRTPAPHGAGALNSPRRTAQAHTRSPGAGRRSSGPGLAHASPTAQASSTPAFHSRPTPASPRADDATPPRRHVRGSSRPCTEGRRANSPTDERTVPHRGSR